MEQMLLEVCVFQLRNMGYEDSDIQILCKNLSERARDLRIPFNVALEHLQVRIIKENLKG